MDWQGQKLVDQIMQYSVVLAAFVSLVVGFAMSSFKVMMMTYAGAVFMILLVVIPDWPYFNRHPLQWVESKATNSQSAKAQTPRFQASTKKSVKSTKK